jgi:hypothetical protein
MEAVSQVADGLIQLHIGAILEKAGKCPTSKGMPCARTIAASEKWAVYRLFDASCAESRTAANTTASRAGYLGKPSRTGNVKAGRKCTRWRRSKMHALRPLGVRVGGSLVAVGAEASP